MSQNQWITRIAILILGINIPFLLVSQTSSLAQESAKLTWSPNQESDLAGYKLYYGESEGNYNGGGDQSSPTSTGKKTSQEITGLTPGEDYFFTLTAVDFSGNESMPSQEVSTVMPSLPQPPNPDGTVIEAEAMTTKSTGQAVPGGWVIAKNGHLEQPFSFPTSGTYHFDVLARGDQAIGIWPTMEIRIDQNTVASLEVNSSKWKYFSATVPVQAGTHDVAIAFVNNYYAPPEDRNLYVDKAWISLKESQQSGLPLSVVVSGNGTVVSSPSGIDCPGTACTAEYSIETLVTLTATPNSGSTFSEWSDGCTGTATTCVVNPEIAPNVTATFIKIPPPPVSLSVGVAGNGTVTSNPTGIDCPSSACSADFDSGTSVTLTASPANGAKFGQWEGACGGNSSSCTFTLESTRNATATFFTPPPPPPPSNEMVIEAEEMATKTTGNTVPEGWVIWKNGYIEEGTTFASTGIYQFDVRARGDLAAGVWPVMEIRIDQTTVASIQVNSSTWSTFSTTVPVQAGTHDVAIAFVNNYYAPPEDRNLYVDRVSIMPGDEIPPSSLITLEAEEMATKTTGNAVPDGWVIWKNGYIEEGTTFASTGTYQFDIRARGDLAAGVWPVMEVRIDQTTVASIQVNSSTWSTFSTTVPVQAGTHDVAIAFVNNYYAPPEDRNLYVDRVSIIQTAESSPSSVSNLLTEDFDDGDFSGWTIVDEGTHQAPSAWSASTGTLMQNSNIYTLPGARSSLKKRATHLFYNAGMSWTNYHLSFTLRSDDNDAVGVMFRYQDSNNYYRFSWDSERNYRRLIKYENGVAYLLAEDPIRYKKGKSYQIEIDVKGNTLTGHIDGTQVFSVHDGSLSTGTIAFYSWANRGSQFDNVTVVE